MPTGDEILAWKKAADEAQPERITVCPYDDWPLEETKTGGLHCKFCGRVYK